LVLFLSWPTKKKQGMLNGRITKWWRNKLN
jgi:hypothetical protein